MGVGRATAREEGRRVTWDGEIRCSNGTTVLVRRIQPTRHRESVKWRACCCVTARYCCGDHCASVLFISEYPRDRGDRVPVARGHRHAKEAVNLAEVTEDLHLAPIETKHESALPAEDPEQPL